MRKLCIAGIVLATFLPFLAQATHLYGVEITATVKSCQSYEYDIIVLVYSDTAADVEFSNGILELGFGYPIDVSMEMDLATRKDVEYNDNIFRVSELVLSNITFPGAGEYVLAFQEFNRNADIVNMRNSVNTPLYVESKLVIDPLLCNSTPQLADTLNYLAYPGSVFRQSLNAIDPDGDSLSVEFVPPQQSADAAVDRYISPLDIDLRYAENPVNAEGNGLPILTANPEALVWNAPNLPGEFVIALRINEWREVNGEWQQLGYITRDLAVHVIDTINNLSFTDIITSTTQKEPEKPKFRLFPNPNEGDFTLEVTDDMWRGATTSLHNIIGLEIDRRTISLGKNAYSIPECQAGIYFLTLQQGELQKVLRFVKR
ncbi:MAG: T9SS type A sorting domain-containing protein [Bacteroidota bacterium]